MFIMISMVKKLVGYFMKKNYEETNQKEFRTEKVIKKKCDKLYVKWKGCDNSFDIWIDKKKFSIVLLYKNEPIFS